MVYTSVSIHILNMPSSVLHSYVDLEIGPKVKVRSRHGVNWKGLSQGSCMPNINALSLILMSKVKVFVTDGQTYSHTCTDRRTDGQTDGRMSFNVPTFAKGGGQWKFTATPLIERCNTYSQYVSIKRPHKTKSSSFLIANYIVYSNMTWFFSPIISMVGCIEDLHRFSGISAISRLGSGR